MRLIPGLLGLLMVGCGQISTSSTLITQKDLSGHRPVYSQLTSDPHYVIPAIKADKNLSNETLTQAPRVL